MAYICNYCGIEHDNATRSIEHIVPEKLLNSSLVLPNVCRFRNNLYARAFETAVTSSKFMGEVLLEFMPVKQRPRIVHLGEVETERRTKEHLWLVNGEHRLRDLPTRATTTVLQIQAFDEFGNSHSIEVELPFAITSRVTGDEHAVGEFRRKVEKERRKVFDYFTQLAVDPTKNAPLFVELEARGLHLRPPKEVAFEEASAQKCAGGPVSDILPTLHSIERLPWTKFYMKIAWCFACLQIGRSALQQLGGDAILDFLVSDVVPERLVGLVTTDYKLTEYLFRKASIDGQLVWLWRADGREAGQLANRVQLPEDLVQALDERQRTEAFLTNYIHFKQPGALDRAAGVPGPQHRHHRITLRVDVRDSGAALVCDVSLFGGILEATIQLSNLTDPGRLAGLAHSKAISF
jgi:hypothetical protein